MSHLYEKYEGTNMWKTIKDALSQLQVNNDIEIMTREEYVVGFLCKALDENDIVPKDT